MGGLDHIDSEVFSPLGSGPIQWVDLSAADAVARALDLSRLTHAIIAGVDVAGACPAITEHCFDLLLTCHPAPPAPWVKVADVARAAESIAAMVRRAPIAATVATHVLRTTANLPFAQALLVESLAYSTLLGGAEFRAWLQTRQPRPKLPASGPLIDVAREGDAVTITLARPEARNAICAAMRDALHEALCAVLDDPSMPAVLVRGSGACFSTGGDLAEFGMSKDLGEAHAVRTIRSCASRLSELGDRATVMLHGACVGSGIEIAAAAAKRRAMPGTFFQLPELRMGLMPGAGGTASVVRAIGRHRTCYMILSGRRIAAEQAAGWGLVDLVEA